MRRKPVWSVLASLLLVASLAPAAAAAPARSAPVAPPDPLAQLTAETGSPLRVSYHPATGRVNFLALTAGAAWHSAAPAGIVVQGNGPADSLQQAVAEAAARQFLDAYGSVFGLRGQPGELAVVRAPMREDGRTYVRFQQSAGAVPLFGAELIVQVNAAGGVEAVIGKALPDVTAPSQPAVTAEKAQSAALFAVAQVHGVSPFALRASQPALWLYNPVLTEPRGGPTRLVWRLEVTPIELLPIRELVLIDAQRGSIALQFNQVHTALNRRTFDAASSSGLPGGLVCDESNPTCAGGDSHEVAAHTFAGHTYAFYQTYHGRDSVDNAGLTLTSTVHYGDDLYENAFWNGQQMVYGDGDGSIGFPLADDVVAHELTHGVTQYESNLFYYYQSGAINESLSDVWGELLDLTNGAGNDSPGVRWQMGEDITGWGAIRNLADPTLFGDPDRMTSSLYRSAAGDVSDPAFDRGGVHSNSGVNNKAASLMVDGGVFNGLTVPAIGITKTAAIYYHTATNLLTSGADYLDLYNALSQSCNTLLGTLGLTAADCQAVHAATDAVEMSLQPVPSHNLDAPLCPAGQTLATTLFFDDLEAGSSNWTFGETPITNTVRWGRDDNFAYSGQYALLGDDFPAATSDSVAAMSASVLLPAGAYLHFQHAYGFDGASADGGQVEYSLDDGATWKNAGGPLADTFFQHNGYNGTISTGPLLGTPGFVADSHGYVSSRLLLSPLAGESVRFRFRLGLGALGADMGWWVDDIRLYTCSGQPGVLSRGFLPLAARAAGATGTWQTILQEGFEGEWPLENSLWRVTEPGYEEYFWGKSSCKAANGSFSAWAMEEGRGQPLSCGANYVNFANARMIYGPFDVLGATAAEFNLNLWLNTEVDPGTNVGYDYVCLEASVNGNDFSGTCYWGDSSGSFLPVSLDLTNVYALGNLTDDSQVWVQVRFHSDSSVSFPEGAFVDDLVIRQCLGGACPSAEEALPVGSSLPHFELFASPDRGGR
jgi:Zn-dependent metalloprotease